MISRVDWHPVDAIVFPGGFFRSPVYVGNRSHSERAAALEATDFGQAVMAAAYRLDAAHPGALIVVGIDSVPYSSDDHGDQMCVAFSPYGVIGIGRKVWPADGDTNWDGRPPVVCYPADFGSPHRIVTLANGSRALLCACYDVFGVAEAIVGPTARIRYIRYLAPDQRYDGAGAGFVAVRRRLVAEWGQLLADQRVDVALTAVHRFQQPGRDIFWQRHGLATASAALGGGLAVGAAFFTDRLPDGRRSLEQPAGRVRRAEGAPEPRPAPPGAALRTNRGADDQRAPERETTRARPPVRRRHQSERSRLTLPLLPFHHRDNSFSSLHPQHQLTPNVPEGSTE